MIPCPAVSTHEFTSDDPRVWSEKDASGPVWLQVVSGRLAWDRPVNTGLARFLYSIEEMMVGFGVTHGTAYATMLGGEVVEPGTLHYDSGARLPERDFMRFTATWSSDGFDLANAFRYRRDPLVEQILEGTVYRTDLPDFFIPGDRRVALFSEGLDLHARAAAPARPGEWGVFCSASLYGPGNEVDLFCPQLAALRSRVPEGVRVLKTRVRERY